MYHTARRSSLAVDQRRMSLIISNTSQNRRRSTRPASTLGLPVFNNYRHVAKTTIRIALFVGVLISGCIIFVTAVGTAYNVLAFIISHIVWLVNVSGRLFHQNWPRFFTPSLRQIDEFFTLRLIWFAWRQESAALFWRMLNRFQHSVSFDADIFYENIPKSNAVFAVVAAILILFLLVVFCFIRFFRHTENNHYPLDRRKTFIDLFFGPLLTFCNFSKFWSQLCNCSAVKQTPQLPIAALKNTGCVSPDSTDLVVTTLLRAQNEKTGNNALMTSKEEDEHNQQSVLLHKRLEQLHEQWHSLDDYTESETRTTQETMQNLEALWKDIGEAVGRIRGMDEDRSKWDAAEDVMINDLPTKIQQLQRYRERLDAQSAQMDALSRHEALTRDDARRIAPAIAEEFLLELNNADSFLKELMQAAAERLELLEEALQQLSGSATGAGTGGGGEQSFLSASVAPPFERRIADNRVPYFVNHDLHTTQWDHPKLADLQQLLDDISSGVKYAAYRVAMRLRAIQKKLYLDLLPLEVATQAFNEHLTSGQIDTPVDCDLIVKCLVQMYERVATAQPNTVNVAVGVDLCLNFVLSVYDPERLGYVKEMSFKTLIVLLCNGAVQNKYRAVFRMIVDARGRADHDRFARFMHECVQLPRYLGELNAFGGEDVESSVRSCFSTSETKDINISQLLKWIGQEPQSLVWLTVLHRLILAENTRHNVRCSVCHIYPIVGLRYRSLIKFNLDLCQACFLSGRYLKKHKEYHPMQEYCLPTTSGEAFRDLRRIVSNKFKGKGYFRRHPRRGYLPVGNNTLAGSSAKSENNDDSIASGGTVSATTSATHTPARTHHSMRAQSTPPRGPLTRDVNAAAGDASSTLNSRSGTLNTTKNLSFGPDEALDAATYGARIIEHDMSSSSGSGGLKRHTVRPAPAHDAFNNNTENNNNDGTQDAATLVGERDEHQLIKRYCDVLKRNFDGADENDVQVLNRALLSGPDSVIQTAEFGVRLESQDYLRQLQQDHERLLREFEQLHGGGGQNGDGLNAADFSPPLVELPVLTYRQPVVDESNTADMLTTERRALQVEKSRMEAQMRMLQDHNKQLDAQLKRIKGLISDAQGAAAYNNNVDTEHQKRPKANGNLATTHHSTGRYGNYYQKHELDLPHSGGNNNRHNFSASAADSHLFASPLSPHSQTFSAAPPPPPPGALSFASQARAGSFRNNREEKSDFAELYGAALQRTPAQFSTPPRRRQQPQPRVGGGDKASVGQLLNAVGDLNTKLGKLVTVMTDDEEGGGAGSSYENHQQQHSNIGGKSAPSSYLQNDKKQRSSVER